MDNQKIKDLILALQAEGITLTADEIKKLTDPKNIKIGGMLGEMKDKINLEDSNKSDKSAKENIIDEQKERDIVQNELFSKNGFNRRKGRSSLAQYERETHLPTYYKDKKVDRMMEAYNKRKELNEMIAELEIEDAPIIGRDNYIVISEENKETYLQDIQNGIGNYNTYNKKYKVTQASKKNGQPSLDLIERQV